jgi:predicted outer membrane lipoprotein
MEMTMLKKTLLSLVVLLLAALTVQTAVASEHHRMRAKDRTVAIEQFRNSNAFAAPGGTAAQSALSADDEGAMTSGLAGH